MGILGSILDTVTSPLKDIISEVVVDKDKKNELLYKIKELEDRADERVHEEVMAQIEVNKVEAASSSIFVAGWRPFVGWASGAGLVYSAIIEPTASWIARIAGYTGTFPVINNELLLYVLGAMLGVGAMRSYEKVKGVATSDMTTTNLPQEGAVTKTETTTKTVEVSAVPSKKKKFKLF